MEDAKGTNRLYSLDEAARQLGISVWTMRAHAKKGGSLRTTRVGRRVLVSALELDRITASGLPSLADTKPDGAAANE
jgi:excisionase family DNA binding protein